MEHHNIADDLKFPEFILYKPHCQSKEVCVYLYMNVDYKWL